MAGFFTNFPIIPYNINFKSDINSNYIVTNPFYRLKFREYAKNYINSYYYYSVRQQDTPESLAYKYYGDPMAYWIIMFANDMVNPVYDWPLTDKKFNDYIRDKYGSIATAQSTIHHYNKLITTTDSRTGISSTKRVQINYDDPRTTEGTELPYDDFVTLAETYYPNVSGNFRDGSAVEVIIEKEHVYAYDHEYELNEAKRNIKIVRKDHYANILKEFEELTFDKSVYIRELRNF